MVKPVTRSRLESPPSDDTEVIAVERARDAFNCAAADPALVELIRVISYPAESQEPTEPAETTTGRPSQ